MWKPSLAGFGDSMKKFVFKISILLAMAFPQNVFAKNACMEIPYFLNLFTENVRLVQAKVEDDEFWQIFKPDELSETISKIKCDTHSSPFQKEFSFSKSKLRLKVYSTLWDMSHYLSKLSMAFKVFATISDLSKDQRKYFVDTVLEKKLLPLRSMWSAEYVDTDYKSGSSVLYKLPFIYDIGSPNNPYYVGDNRDEISFYDAHGLCVALGGHSRAYDFGVRTVKGAVKMKSISVSGITRENFTGYDRDVIDWVECSPDRELW